MTAATEIPADVMAAAERAAQSSVERPYNKGTVSRAAAVIALAILAERQRCVALADAEVEAFRHHDAPQAAFGALTVRRAIQGPTI